MSKSTTAGKRVQRIFLEASMEKYQAALNDGDRIDSTSASHNVSHYGPDRLAILSGMAGSGNAASNLPALSKSVPWDQLSDSWLCERLREAVADNDANLFKLLLHHLLANIGAYPPPQGAFTPWPKLKNPGRPVSSANEEIYAAWKHMDNPSMKDLAGRVFGSRYRTADDIKRRNYRNQCRKAVIRALERENRDLAQKVTEARAQDSGQESPSA